MLFGWYFPGVASAEKRSSNDLNRVNARVPSNSRLRESR